MPTQALQNDTSSAEPAALIEGLAVPFAVGYGLQRLALLLASSQGFDRVAEGKDRQHIQLGRHAGDWKDVFIYFKHEEEGKGAEFAQLLAGMISWGDLPSRGPPP